MNDIVFETERLYLRKMTQEDIDILMPLFAESPAMTFFPENVKREKISTWIQNAIISYEENGFGMWLCFTKEDDTFVGQCGLMNNQIDKGTHVELGFSILRSFRGNKYATEATKASVNFGLKELMLGNIVSVIDPSNAISKRVAMQIGMQKVKTVKRWEKKCDLFMIIG